MKMLSRAMVTGLLLAGCSVFAKADTITWTFSDVLHG